MVRLGLGFGIGWGVGGVNSLAYIQNLSHLLCLETFEKFVWWGGGGGGLDQF